MIVFFDTETIPSQKPDALAQVCAAIKPPATLKKPESIARWWGEESASAAEAEWRRQSLDGGLQGEICSIAACTDAGREWSHCRAEGASEAELLHAFFRMLDLWQSEEAAKLPALSSAWPPEPVYLVAHNAAFDVPLVWRRAVVLGEPLPTWWPTPQGRAGRDWGDTMLSWAGWRGHVSLDALCRALGLESPKGDLDGAQVFDAWRRGECERIARYNLADARAVGAVWHRLQGRGLTV